MTTNSIVSSAAKLSKTPLGIIALFVLLSEAISGLVISASNLSSLNQTILVCFISAFPIIVVIMFWNLVVNHNIKLYAPSEYPNHGDFLAANSIKKEKLIEDLKKDLTMQIETLIDKKKDRYSRGEVREQVGYYIDAAEIISSKNLSKIDIEILEKIKTNEITIEEAKQKYGESKIEKLQSANLISVDNDSKTKAMVLLSKVAEVVLNTLVKV